MRLNPRPEIVVALFAISLLVRPDSSFAQEEGQRAVVHDQGVEAPDAAHTEEGRRTEEDRRGGREGSEETRSSRPLTEVEKVSRESDLTKGKDAEFHDLETLSTEVGAPSARSSPDISHDEIEGKSRTQIKELATKKGLVPTGESTNPDFPRKWNDPITNKERLRLDRGHLDKETGKPYDIQNAANDHVHAKDKDGKPITIGGDPHIPTRGD